MEKEIAIFKTDSETINVEVLFEDETVWLTQDQMAQMFEKAKSTINEHIKHIFEEGELDESKVTRKFGNTEFSTDVTKPKLYYNLDVIISVGYRVKSLRGTQFRQWGVRRNLRLLPEFALQTRDDGLFGVPLSLQPPRCAAVAATRPYNPSRGKLINKN